MGVNVIAIVQATVLVSILTIHINKMPRWSLYLEVSLATELPVGEFI